MRWMMALLLAASSAGAEIDAHFENGSIGPVTKVSPSHYRLGIVGEKDNEGRNRQASWYYFRVTKPPHGQLILDLVDLPGEYNYQPNKGPITGDTPPVISWDNKTWRHLTTVEYEASEPRLRVRIQSDGRTFWLAHTPPYGLRQLQSLRAFVKGRAEVREQIIGQSVEKRDLYLWTITSPGDDRQRPSVWLFFRQHSWESGSSWAGEGAVRALLADTPLARKLRDEIVWKVIPASDPDGLAHGGVRFNRKGYDLNRNWDLNQPGLMPEINAESTAIQDQITSGKGIALLFSLHNTETAEYLEGPPGEGGLQSALATRFDKLLREHTSFAPTRPLSYAAASTSLDRPGRMTIIQGNWMRHMVAGFLMEQRIAMNPKLGHFPEIEDRLRFGRELVFAIWAAVRDQPFPTP